MALNRVVYYALFIHRALLLTIRSHAAYYAVIDDAAITKATYAP